MAPYSGPLDGAKNNSKHSEIGIKLSSGEGDGRGGLGPGPHGTRPRSRRSPVVYPTAEMVEQPAEEFRFRYWLESRTNGSIPGINSTPDRKTYPAIKVNDYIGQVVVHVSCVAKDLPYRPHPHRLVSKDNSCRGGVCTIVANITEENRVVQFKNIGIQCVKRSEIKKALSDRKQLTPWYTGDPFRTRIESDPDASIGMHHVRLAVLVLVQDAGGRCCVPLAPFVSDVVTDRPDRLRIVRMAPAEGTALGGTKLILLTEKLPNQQLTVRFLEPSTGWRVDVRPEYIHKMTSLVVETPPYRDPTTPYPVNVIMQLCRPPTGDPVLDRHMIGDPFSFEYTPAPPSPSHSAPKRPRITEKKLHKSLLPPKNCPPLNETAVSPRPEDWMARLDVPGPSSSNYDAQIEKWKWQSAFDQKKIQETYQPPQVKQTTSNEPITTRRKVGHMGQSPHPPVRQTTPSPKEPITARQYSQATQTTQNAPISLARQFEQTVQSPPTVTSPSVPISSREQPPPMRQNIPNNQISSIEQFLSMKLPYHIANSFTVSNDLPTDSSKRQPTPNSSISVGQLPETVQLPPWRQITPNGPISIAQPPSVGYSFPVSCSQNDYTAGQPIPNRPFATVDQSSFLMSPMSQTEPLPSAELSPIGSFGSYMEDMEQLSQIEYSIPEECHHVGGPDFPAVTQLPLQEGGLIFPETDAPMSHEGPMEQYFSPESQPSNQMQNNEPVPDILSQESDIEALINALKELKTTERLEIIRLIGPVMETPSIPANN